MGERPTVLQAADRGAVMMSDVIKMSLLIAVFPIVMLVNPEAINSDKRDKTAAYEDEGGGGGDHHH